MVSFFIPEMPMDVDDGFYVYVNTVPGQGNDSNSGLSFAQAKATLASALSLLATRNNVGTIRINAPSTNPVTGFVQFTFGNITLEGIDGNEWYVERTTTFTSGWSDQGGGIWSRSDGGVTAFYLYVTTLTDANGFELVLAKNTVTPTTPAAGEFGQTGGNYYVHLPGDVSPNSNTIKRHVASYLFQSAGTANVIIKNCVGRYNGSGGVFENTSANSSLDLQLCKALYSGVGVTNSGKMLTATNCEAHRCANDGFSQNAGIAYFIDCIASYNDDEGGSPHNGSTLYVTRGHYHHNFSGGLTAVNNNTKMYVENALVEYNGAKNQAGIEKNGINFDTGTSGSVKRSISRNNTGSGYYCNSASVILIDLVSGLSQGNTLADVICP